MRHAARFAAFVIVIATCSCFGLSAVAQDKKLYLSAYLGLNTLGDQDYQHATTAASGTIDIDSAPSFGGALGFHLTPSVSLEAEIGYSTHDINSFSGNTGTGPLNGSLDAMTFMLNGRYDFNLDWPVVPYVSAGAGFGLFDASIRDAGSNLIQNSSGNDWSLVYQLGGGLRYRLSDGVSLSGGYRYVGASDIEFDRTTVDYSSHQIRFGLHYDLPVGWDQ